MPQERWNHCITLCIPPLKKIEHGRYWKPVCFRIKCQARSKNSVSTKVFYIPHYVKHTPKVKCGVPIISPPAKRQKVTYDIMYILLFRRKKDSVCWAHLGSCLYFVKSAQNEISKGFISDIFRGNISPHPLGASASAIKIPWPQI